MIRATLIAILLVCACAQRAKPAPQPQAESAAEPVAESAAGSAAVEPETQLNRGLSPPTTPDPDWPEHAQLQTVPIELVSLEDSLAPLRARFNEEAKKMRLLALLSPNCELCIQGIKSIFDEVLLAHPHAEIHIDAVWMRAQGAERKETAFDVAHFAPTPRVTHYWDPENRAGKFVGHSLAGHEELAWDIYLFFEPGKTWGDELPEPIRWTSQRTNIDASKLPRNMSIRHELRALMEELADYIPE